MLKKFRAIVARCFSYRRRRRSHGTGLKDGQITFATYAAGQIDAARQALERSGNAEVRPFAKAMICDHTAMTDRHWR